MNLIEPTLTHPLKIWWAFDWRAGVLMVPAMFVLMISMVFLMPFPQPGEPPQLDNRKIAVMFAIVYPLMFVAIVESQVVGMRWMLRTQRWRDFFCCLDSGQGSCGADHLRAAAVGTRSASVRI